MSEALQLEVRRLGSLASPGNHFIRSIDARHVVRSAERRWLFRLDAWLARKMPQHITSTISMDRHDERLNVESQEAAK